MAAGMATDSDAQDYGLASIARQLGKSEAVQLFWDAAAKEDAGFYEDAIANYRRAYRLWPALDSRLHGGIPLCVREEAEAGGITCYLATVVDVAHARATRVMRAPALLTARDIDEIDAVRRNVEASESALTNNPNNATHEHKTCLFLNNPPRRAMSQHAPAIIEKVVGTAV